MVSVGIDVSKGKSTVCALNEDGEVLLPSYEIQHTEDDVALLIEHIKQLPEPRRVVLENTGYYHWPVVNKLMEAGEYRLTKQRQNKDISRYILYLPLEEDRHQLSRR